MWRALLGTIIAAAALATAPPAHAATAWTPTERVRSALLDTALQAMFDLPGKSLTMTVRCHRVSARHSNCKWSLVSADRYGPLAEIDGTARVIRQRVVRVLSYDPDAIRRNPGWTGGIRQSTGRHAASSGWS